jgi:hypothetical protein
LTYIAFEATVSRILVENIADRPNFGKSKAQVVASPKLSNIFEKLSQYLVGTTAFSEAISGIATRGFLLKLQNIIIYISKFLEMWVGRGPETPNQLRVAL